MPNQSKKNLGVTKKALKPRDGGNKAAKKRKPKPRKGIKESENYYIGFLQQNKWLEEVVEAPTFYPTLEEFADPAKYIQLIEPEASKYGICKIQPPKELQNNVHLFSEDSYKDFKFTVRSQKMREHEWDDFHEVDVLFDVAGSCTLEQFHQHANGLAEDHLGSSAPMPPNFVEVEYWRQRSLTSGRPLYVEYGNDVEGSAFKKSDIPSVAGTRWNLQEFGKDDGSILRHLPGDLPGITSPMLYIGSVFATFFWHVEDHFMHSINFMHCGAPKTWYGVPGENAGDFEDACLNTVYKTAINDLKTAGYSEEEVHAFGLRNLMKKTTMFSPKHLVEQEAKYRDSKGPLSVDDECLLRHFIAFMKQQRELRSILIHQGMPARAAYASQQSHPCYTCGRKSFLAQVITDEAHECHCLSCASKDLVKAKAKMVINPVVPALESAEGALRVRLNANDAPAGREENILAAKPPFKCQDTENIVHEDNHVSSPSSTSTNMHSLEGQQCNPPEACPVMRVTKQSNVLIGGQSFQYRRLTASQGNKTEHFALLEEMLRAMGAPVRNLADAEQLFGIMYRALKPQFHMLGCFDSGSPKRGRIGNLNGEVGDGIPIRECEARAILSTVDGNVRERLSVYLQGIWDNI